MKSSHIIPFLFAASVAFAAGCSGNSNNVSDNGSATLSSYVEPRIGTAHCRWFHFTPGAMPFGMAKPGPSTNGHLGNASGWEATGYDYRDVVIDGFPCLHEFQVGGITLMPTSGQLITVPGDTVVPGYRSHFSHDDEIVKPGYYSVRLKDTGITAEVTATPRVAFQRYTFPKSDSSRIIFDIGNRAGESGPVEDAQVRILDNGRCIEGMVVTKPEYVKIYQPEATVPLYFHAVVDTVPASFGTFLSDRVMAGTDSVSGKGAGAYIDFPTADNQKVTVKVGLSYTSIANARLNLETEAKELSFDEACAAATGKWEEMLSRIEVETDSIDDKVKFYTGLYHALLGRGLSSDVNGDYPRNDGSVGRLPLGPDGKPVHNMYNTDAIWGGQWNLVQLWALAYPEYLSDYISSHLQMYKDAGWLADGTANCRYVSGVGTNLLSTVIVAAYQCGIRDFDLKTAYEACLKNELDGNDRPMGAGKSDTDLFVKYGYVPHPSPAEERDGSSKFSASHTLEYSYSAGALAKLARKLGHDRDADTLRWLSKGWERIFDTESGFMRPRNADGSFISDFKPMEVWRGFQEGNAWQYTFYVPHEPEALIEKVGKEVFVNRLDSIFTVSRDKIFSGGTEIGAFAGLQTLYNHGNQPCLHISWLFSHAGRPSLTRKWVRLILDEFYGTDGIHGYGYGQDEDQGQLGAWYVMSSIGLFDVSGLTADSPSFAIGSPKFDKVTVKLNPDYYRGSSFVIQTAGNSPQNVHVSSATLNGSALESGRIPFQSVTDGGTLRLDMTDTPNDRL